MDKQKAQQGVVLIVAILLLMIATLLVSTVMHAAMLNFKIAQQQIVQQRLLANLEIGLINAQQLLTTVDLKELPTELWDQTFWEKFGKSMVIDNIKMQYVYQLVAERDCMQIENTQLQGAMQYQNSTANIYSVKIIRIAVRSVDYPELMLSRNYIVPVSQKHDCSRVVQLSKNNYGWSATSG